MHVLGLRYRVNDRRLPGSPDIVLPKWRAVVFVHGCYWHRHAGCRFASVPKRNSAFWEAKFQLNVERDLRKANQLRTSGWVVFVVWECEIKRDVDAVAQRVLDGLIAMNMSR